MTTNDHDWLKGVPVTVFRAANTSHFKEDGHPGTLHDVLFAPLDGEAAYGEDGGGHYPVLHWSPYRSDLNKRLLKLRCPDIGACDRHTEEVPHDRDVEVEFGTIVVEIDLSEEAKKTATASTHAVLMAKIRKALGRDEPNITYPSPSWGGRLIWVPSEPITSGNRYEQCVLHYHRLVGEAVEKAGVGDVAHMDPTPKDRTRLWKCCQIRGHERNPKTGEWIFKDTLDTHRPTVIHNRRVDADAIPVIEIKEAEPKPISQLDRARVATAAKGKTRVKRALRYLRKIPPAISGEGGSGAASTACFVGHSFGLDKEETLRVMTVEWNERCSPPWEEDDLRRKIDWAWDQCDRPWGWRITGDGLDEDEGYDDDEAFAGMSPEERAEAEKEIDERIRYMNTHWPDGTLVEPAMAQGSEKREGTTTMQDTTPEEVPEQVEQVGLSDEDYDMVGAAIDLWKEGDGDAIPYDLALSYYRKTQRRNAKIAEDNADAKRDELKAMMLPLPDGYDMVRLRCPHLICTSAKDNKREWVDFHEKQGWSRQVNVKDMVRFTFADMKVPPTTNGYRGKVDAIADQLGSDRAVAGLEISKAAVIKVVGGRKVAEPLPEDEIKHVVAGEERLILVCPDGTWTTEPHSPDIYSPFRLGCDPEKGETPFIDAVLKTVFRGDQERIDAWLDWCAYCLIPGNDLKKFLLLVSAGGSGKTTLLYMLRAAVGDHNATAHDDRALTDRFFHDGLRTSLVNISEEINPYGREIESTIKAVTGGSAMSWAVKYGSIGSYVPQWKIVIATNDDPTLVDDSGAYASRMVMIRTSPITETVVKFTVGRDLSMRLERERAALLWRLLERLEDIADNGLTIPKESEQDVRQLRLVSSPVLEWWEDSVALDEDGWAPRDKLYESYVRWIGIGEKPMAKRTFLSKLRHLPEVAEHIRANKVDPGKKRPADFGGKDGNKDRGWAGIRLEGSDTSRNDATSKINALVKENAPISRVQE